MRKFAVLAFLSVCINSSLCQTPSRTKSLPPKRDALAVVAMSALSNSYGWHKGNLPADALITGTVTRYMGDTAPSADFTIKLRGADQYRYEEGGFVATTNGAAGMVTNPGGKHVRISGQSALAMREILPSCFRSSLSESVSSISPGFSLRCVCAL